MMPLENHYFRILSADCSATDAAAATMEATYRVELLADCDVYRGHFPHEPVSPGVCNIGMIQECAGHMAGRRLRIATIKQCRLTAVASPQACPQLDVTLSAVSSDAGWDVTATLSDGEKTYMTFKGTFV